MLFYFRKNKKELISIAVINKFKFQCQIFNIHFEKFIYSDMKNKCQSFVKLKKENQKNLLNEL